MKRWRWIALSGVVMSALATATHAERIENPIARFSGLDKITGTTTNFEVRINEEARFGRLIVKPFACYTRPVTEEPKTSTFVQVDQLDLANQRKRIFSGWMFAESPGLSAVEDPTYDVWLTGCFDPNAPPPPIEIPVTSETKKEGEDGEEEDSGQETDEPAQQDGTQAEPDAPIAD